MDEEEETGMEWRDGRVWGMHRRRWVSSRRGYVGSQGWTWVSFRLQPDVGGA